MANTKKYVSFDKLSLYDEKIKKVITDGDAAALASAKSYADGLAVNYDAAGSAATAESNAKGYTDGKIGEVNGVVAGVKTTAEKGVSDAAAAKAAADAAQASANAAQSDVDALEKLVGTLPEGTTAKDVVDYVNLKTSGIATDAALGELQGKVTAAQEDIDAIEADYLKAEHYTSLSDMIAGETTRASDVEGGLDTRLKAVEKDYLTSDDKDTLQGSIDGVDDRVTAIEGDYLKTEDKTWLTDQINFKADKTALAQEVTDRTNAVAGLQTQINTIMSNPDAEGAINSINEFTAYVTEHGTIAEGMRADINKNKASIEGEVDRATKAETALSGRLDTLEAIDHEAYIGADTALKNELNTEIAKKANASDVATSVKALEDADAAQVGRIVALEAKFTGDSSVAEQIATAKEEAIDAAAADATTKAGNAETAAKGYADSLNTAMDTRVQALEAIDHDHSNKALLDTYTQTEANLADAVAKKHAHENEAVLNGITAEKVAAWDAAEGNAKTYADGLNTTMTGRVDGIENRVSANETAIAKKAETTALNAVADRVTAIETWHSNFVEVSEEEINSLFTTAQA